MDPESSHPMSDSPGRDRRLPASLYLIAVGAVLLVAAIWVAALSAIEHERDSAIASARKETVNLSIAFEEQIIRTIHAVDTLLLRTMDIARRRGAEAARGEMKSLHAENEDLVTVISMADAGGDITVSSLDGAVNIAHRSHFRAHAERRDAGLVFGIPVQGQRSGQWTMHLARRVDLADGSFGGVVTAGVELDYLVRLYRMFDLGPDGLITLLGRDGELRVESSRRGVTATATRHRPPPVIAHVERGEAYGSFVDASAIDDVRRIVSYRALADYPLIVTVGIADRDALRHYATIRGNYAIGAAALTAFVLLLAAALGALFWRHIDANQRLSSSESRFRAFTDLGADWYWESNAQHRIAFASASVSHWTGSAWTTLAGKPLWEIGFMPAGAMSQDARRAIEALEPFRDSKLRYLDPDGRLNYFSASGEPVHGNDGRFCGYRGICRDITRETRLQQRLRLQNEVARLLAGTRPVEHTITALLREICETFDWAGGVRRVIDRRAGAVSCAEIWCAPGLQGSAIVEATATTVYPLRPQGMLAAAIDSGEPQWRTDVTAPHGLRRAELLREAGIVEMIAFPIQYDDGRRYVFEFWSRHREQPDPIAIDTLRAIATEADRFLSGMVAREHLQRERERVVQVLLEREEHYRHLFEANPMPMWIVRNDTLHLLLANDAAVRLYGYEKHELEQMTVRELQPPELLPAYEEYLKRRRATGPTYHRRTQHRRKDGSVIDVDVTSHLITYASAPARLVIAQDVTERLKSEAVLREREQLLRVTFDAAPIGVNIVALDGRFMRANPAYQQLVGYSEDELRGMTTFALNHPDDTPRNRALREELLAGKQNLFEIEERYRTRDGRVVWVQNRVTLVRDAAGNPAFTVAAVKDITAQRLAEQRLRESENLLRAIIEQAALGITITDASDKFVKANPAFQRMLGYSEDELLDRYVSSLTVGEDDARNRVLVAELIAGTRDSFSIEKRHLTRENNVVWVLNTVSALKDDAGAARYLITVTENITGRKQLEQDALRKTRITELLERLARAANEAQSPEEAMKACLAHICQHGEWVLGRLGMYAPGEDGFVPGYSVWHEKHPDRYAEFKSASLDDRKFSTVGQFITAVLRDNRPVWLEDIPKRSGTGRHLVAAACGLGSAFAFPVSVRGNVVAFLEFYAEQPRAPDSLLIEASISVGAMLARLVERSHAAAERERLAAIVENSNDAIWSRAADDTLLTWNAAAERLFGWRREEVLGRRASFLVPPDRMRERAEIPARLARGEDSITLETVRLRKSGAQVDVELRASVVRDDAGNVIWTAFTAHDITERKRAEQDLRRKTALTQLLEVITRAVNEAVSPRAVIQECLERICAHGSWDLGHFAMMGWKDADGVSHVSTWHEPAGAGQFAGFVYNGDGVLRAAQYRGRFAAVAITEKRPIWISDLAATDGLRRLRHAVQQGLRSAFGFPVFVGDEVVAFVEFFATDAREPDEALIAAANVISAQLTHLIERDRAFRTAARLAAIVENATVAIVTRTLEGTILTWNPGAETMLGYSADEAIGRHVAFTLPNNRPSNLERNNERLLRGEILSFESDRVTKDGRTIDVLTSHSALRDGAGNIIGTSIILQDITELKRAQAAVAESEERFRTIFEHAPSGIAQSDTGDNRFTAVNPAFARMLDYSREELLGMPVAALTHPAEPADVLENRARMLRGALDRLSGEHRMVRKNGTMLWVNRTVVPVRTMGSTPRHFIGVYEDITERKAAETTLRDYSHRLQVLSRKVLEAQENERAMIARELHDQLGQTLSAAKLGLQLFQRRHRDAARVSHFTDTIDTVDQALRQVRSLALDLRPPQLDHLGLSTTLRTYAERIAKPARLKLYFSAEPLPALPPQIDIACFRVAQGALTNIVRHADAANVWVTLAVEGDMLCLRVHDDGNGCDLKRAQRQALRGRSMGLLSMEERTRLAGGRFTIRSEPGSGMEVRAQFPIAVEAPATVEEP